VVKRSEMRATLAQVISLLRVADIPPPAAAQAALPAPA
jgi:hypothetical protein